MPLVKVDTPGSSILRGLAIPFGEYAFMVSKDGDLFAEVFDEESIPRLPQNVPLLVSHDRDRPPAGKVTSSVIMRQGLGIEAKLVGDDHELEGWRRRFDAGLMVGLSIGFRTGSGKAIWEPPPKQGMPPVKRVRGAEIVEVSLVNYPARQRRDSEPQSALVRRRRSTPSLGRGTRENAGSYRLGQRSQSRRGGEVKKP